MISTRKKLTPKVTTKYDHETETCCFWLNVVSSDSEDADRIEKLLQLRKGREQSDYILIKKNIGVREENITDLF